MLISQEDLRKVIFMSIIFKNPRKGKKYLLKGLTWDRFEERY